MTPESKISPAFEPFLEKSGPNDRRDAIVVFKTKPPVEEARVRGRLRALKLRLKLIHERAAAQMPVQEKMFKSYQTVVRKTLPGKQDATCELSTAHEIPSNSVCRVASPTSTPATSMATPHVAGVAALLMAAQPAASADDIARTLKDTAEHPGGPSSRPDNRWGYGMIQPAKAIDALAS
jgi:hypothetical protein